MDDCHYITHGNYEALSMVRLAQKILGRLGVDPRRLRIEWVSAGEGIRFSNIMNEFGKEIKELGPLGQSEGLDPAALRTGLEEVIRLIPYIKLAKKDKLALHLKKEEEYRTLYSDAEVAALFEETVSYCCIDPEKCQACMACLRRCPAEAIEGGKKHDPRDRPGQVPQMRHLPGGLPLPVRGGAKDLRRAGPVPHSSGGQGRNPGEQKAGPLRTGARPEGSGPADPLRAAALPGPLGAISLIRSGITRLPTRPSGPSGYRLTSAKLFGIIIYSSIYRTSPLEPRGGRS